MAPNALKNIANRSLCHQGVVAVILAAGSYLVLDTDAAKAILFGSSVALVNALLLSCRMYQDKHSKDQSAHRHLRMFYRSSIERFVVIAALLASGMGPLGLLPLAVLAGFALGQVTLIISQIMHGIKSN